MSKAINPEFSRTVAAATVGDGAVSLDIEADVGERAALARRLDLVSLDRLSATLRLASERGGIVRLDGNLVAEVTQACVITLAPVTSHITAPIERRYGPGGEVAAGEAIVEIDEEEPPEAIVDGVIDVGEAVAEQLALELDPFPRAPDAVFDGYSSQPADRPEGKGPFAVLAGLKTKRD